MEFVDLQAYLAVRERVDVLVRHANVESSVPGCPDWRVRDVVAHLAGLCDDWVEGRLEGYGSDAWTATQVQRFSGATVEDILNCWSQSIERFRLLPDDPRMGRPARWAFGDAITHEADIRGALRSGRAPHEAVLLALKGAIARWRLVLRDSGVPSLRVRAVDAREWWAGALDDVDTVSVETTAYELFRALAGRRSASQVRSWRWSTDPALYLSAGLPFPFAWASTDIID
jgi:uncharacterized protein (TIGR03083 family)